VSAPLARGQRILVVCTGNICRSPYAERWLAAASARHGLALELRSRGTHATPGRPCPEEARFAALERGVDLDGHRAAPLTVGDLRWAGLVLAMGRSHGLLVETMTAGLEAAPGVEVLDVPDPYGLDLRAYHEAFARIERVLGAWLPAPG